jgi:replicative DNA helicase
MSDALKKFQEALEQEKEKDKINKEKWESLKEKKLLVETHRYTNELEKIKKNEEDLERASTVNVGILSDEAIVDIQNKNRAYLDGAKNGMVFLNKELGKIVPFWPGSLVLLGSRTGGGKSSLTANLIVSTLGQIVSSTGKNRRVLTISCEETPLQVYNRLTCLIKGYNYDAQDEFTEEQKQVLVEFTARWAKNGVTVIGEDDHGITSSIEGVRSIFENLIKTNTHYDLILIDYIQKITSSRKNPGAKSWEVLKDTMYLLDGYKNKLQSAIVVMSQLSSQKTGEDEVELDFQDRLRGCRDLITPATAAIELVPDYALRKSKFVIRKNRYKGNTVGGFIELGYEKGKFVSYTDDFKKKVAKDRESQEWQDSVGKHIEEPKEDPKPKEPEE